MLTLNNLKTYINSKFNVKIESKSRKRNVVYARVIFANLALNKIPKTSLEAVGKCINKNHATIIHYRDELIEVIKANEPELYSFYETFSELNLISIKSKDFGDLLVKYKLLLDSHIKIQNKLRAYENNLKSKINIKEFVKILDSVPNDKLDLFYFRIKPIAKMLNSSNILK